MWEKRNGLHRGKIIWIKNTLIVYKFENIRQTDELEWQFELFYNCEDSRVFKAKRNYFCDALLSHSYYLHITKKFNVWINLENL
ncbi:hypothetical protein RRG08_035082 [Elysia crispata]|uniref:Uncharacterized protein n=1 Tax=Elysia crispata TaxID=231223 RepID=A0AAE0ZS86_9GAST|nr:hypothetical protein RRG08_035082 [Elysia crispata]